MSMIKFETIYEGSTFLEQRFALYENGEPVTLAGADVLVHVKRKNDPDVIEATYATAGASPKLTLSGNEIVMPEHEPTLEPGKYVLDFNITFATGHKETGFLQGEWEILNPVTHRP